jgi:hypothetical protein
MSCPRLPPERVMPAFCRSRKCLSDPRRRLSADPPRCARSPEYTTENGLESCEPSKNHTGTLTYILDSR